MADMDDQPMFEPFDSNAVEEYVWDTRTPVGANQPHPDRQRYVPLPAPVEELHLTDELLQALYKPFKPNQWCPTPWLKDVVPGTTFTERKFLAHKNGHPRDSRITMAVEPHKYFIDGSCEHWMSGTELLKQFFPPFESDTIANNTLQSKTYLTCKHRPSYKYYGCQTVEDIQRVWLSKRDMGTDLHANIEAFWNGEEFNVQDINEHPFGLFKKLFEDKRWVNWDPYQTEWTIFDEESYVSGSIDFAGRIQALYTDKDMVLIDWKRCESIDMCSFERLRGLPAPHGYGPCWALESTKFNQYSLQLNLYKYLVEKRYGFNVKKMIIVRLHPNCKEHAQVILVPEMQPIIRQIIQCRIMALKRASAGPFNGSQTSNAHVDNDAAASVGAVV